MKPLEDRTFNELVEWASGYLLQQLLAGDFQTGVYTVMSTTASWRRRQDERELGPKRPVPKRHDGSAGKYEAVCNSELSTRAKNALIRANLTDAYAVRNAIKNFSGTDKVGALKKIPNIGTRIALEIINYYEVWE